MKKCTLEIKDEVNCKFKNVDPSTRRRMVKELKYFVPWAFHVPSYKLGRWDGTTSFFSMGGETQINLLDKVLPIVTENGYDIDVVDHRKNWEFQFSEIDNHAVSDCAWPKGHDLEGQSIVLRDHQVDVINSFLKNPQSIQEAATASGKTLITATLSKIVGQYGRSIIIVPNKTLVTQTEKDYKNLSLDVGVYYGERKEYDHQHVICTWQSLNVLDKKSKEYDEEILHEILKDVICVIVDETHTAKSQALHKLLSGPMSNIPLRWGLTGTVPKEDYVFFNILGVIGPVVNQLKAKDLQEKDILANCHISVKQTQESVQFNDYQEEKEFLLEDSDRLEFITKIIENARQEGNTLVLVEKIKTGKILDELIPDSVFVSGETKGEERKEHYNNIQTGNNLILIGTFGILSTGIDIPRIFNLVLIEPGKSFVRVIQSIGRGLRKAQDKDYVQVFDICANTKYSKKHLTERKKYYKEAEYPFKVEKINRW